MELTEKDIQLIDSYLRGELSPSDKLSFEKRLKVDDELRKETDLYRRLFIAIEKDGRREMKARLSAVGTAAISSGNLKQYKPGKGGATLMGKMITLLIMVVACTLFYQVIDSPKVLREATVTDSMEEEMPSIQSAVPEVQSEPEINQNPERIILDSLPTKTIRKTIVREIVIDTVLEKGQVLDTAALKIIYQGDEIMVDTLRKEQ